MKKYPFITSFRICVVFSIITLSIFASALTQQRADAADPDITGGAPVTGQVSVPTPISDLQLTGTGNPTVPVRLYVTSGSLEMSTTTGITFDGPTSGDTVEFSGTMTNVNAALATLTYTRGSVGTDTLEVSLVEAGDIFFPGNNHLYEVVSSTLSWDNANAAANGLTKYGSQGYLATVSNEEENEYIADRLSSPGWFGASDSGFEGDWKWVSGPEADTIFWIGDDGGSAEPGQYANWDSGEPNNASNEDCAQYLSGSGLWNDLPCSGFTLPAYVVEYGASGDLPEVASKQVPITTANTPSTPSAPTATAGIQSAQVSFTAPASNGSSITGYTITSSPGGITASGSSSPITVTGLTGGTSYTFTVIATNGVGDSSASGASNAVIPTQAPAFDDDLLAMPRVGVPYSDEVTADGYPIDMTFAVATGTLPPGLSLDADSGEVTGTPTIAGIYTFTLSASNGVGTDATKAFELIVASEPAIDLKLEFEVGATINDDLSVLVSGTGLKEGSEYTVVVESTPRTIASGLVGSNNSFVTRAYLPRDLEAGFHSITVYGTSMTNGLLSDSAYFRINNSGRVLAVSDTAAIGDEIPLTGTQISFLVIVSLGMIGAGSVLLVRRKSVKLG